MSQNKLNIKDIRQDVDMVSLSPTLRQESYVGLFYDHLTWMLKFRMLSEYHDVSNINLNTKTYLGLEQFIFENTVIVEKNEVQGEIDWDMIEDAKGLLREKVKRGLGPRANTDLVNPLIKFTVSNYENYLIYKSLHPQSNSNPWEPSREILFKNGCMVSITDTKTTALMYNNRLDDRMEVDTSDLFVLASSGKDRSSAFQVDTRNNTQGMVYEYLRRDAAGEYNKKPAKDILSFLWKRKKRFKDNDLRNYVLLPLKRAGLIGSTTGGYFFICDQKDLQTSYTHHKKKIAGIERTLVMYRTKAQQMGWNLEE